MEKFKSKRRGVQELEERLQQLERGLSVLTEDESRRLQDVGMLETRIQSLSQELAEQQSKRDRAFRQCQKYHLP
jgi:hypothetical protein